MNLTEKHIKVRREFELRGESISDWADKQGFKRQEVYAVLSGRVKGVRGTAHLIAQKLGLKGKKED